jgi:hypothetical protein
LQFLLFSLQSTYHLHIPNLMRNSTRHGMTIQCIVVLLSTFIRFSYYTHSNWFASSSQALTSQSRCVVLSLNICLEWRVKTSRDRRPCSFINRCQSFEGTSCLQFRWRIVKLYNLLFSVNLRTPSSGSLRNVNIYLSKPHDIAFQNTVIVSLQQGAVGNICIYPDRMTENVA